MTLEHFARRRVCALLILAGLLGTPTITQGEDDDADEDGESDLLQRLHRLANPLPPETAEQEACSLGKSTGLDLISACDMHYRFPSMFNRCLEALSQGDNDKFDPPKVKTVQEITEDSFVAILPQPFERALIRREPGGKRVASIALQFSSRMNSLEGRKALLEWLTFHSPATKPPVPVIGKLEGCGHGGVAWWSVGPEVSLQLAREGTPPGAEAILKDLESPLLLCFMLPRENGTLSGAAFAQQAKKAFLDTVPCFGPGYSAPNEYTLSDEKVEELVKKGSAAFKAGNYRAAAAALKRAWLDGDAPPAACYALGLANAKLGRKPDGMLSAYRRGYVPSLMFFGDMEWKEGKIKSALDSYREYIERHGDDPESLARARRRLSGAEAPPRPSKHSDAQLSKKR